MLKILKEIIGVVNYPQTTIGNTVYVKLDENRNVEIRLYDSRVSKNFDCLSLKLVHKERGILHRQDIHFSEVFFCMQDYRGLGKHVWLTNSKYAWYGTATEEDIQKLNETINNYINMWV